MADPINPNLPLRRIGPNPQRTPPEPPAREPRRRKRPGGGITDDQGERRDERPLIDDFA